MTVDAHILSALRAAGLHPISPGELAQRVGVPHSLLAGRVEQLRSLGYEIEATPHMGYRLRGAPDVLHPDDLLSRLADATQIIGRHIRVFQETTSTNDVVEKFARDGAKEGVVVIAEAQTRGRGRLGRKWVSPSGKGLWFSVLLRPQLGLEMVTQITIAAATALTRAIRAHTELRPEIKWPNDVVIRGRKTAGILTELTAELDRVAYVILGIGVDVNLDSSDLPQELHSIATSLKIERNQPVDRPALAAGILRELDAVYARITHDQFDAVADEWEAQCSTLGRDVQIQVGDRVVRGRAESLDRDGALLLRTHHGHLERICGGDVTIQKDNS
jgi:BirA family biotin operon repressor/biotin-[acetyl-CoA-carboxylase] ligase